MTLERRPTAHKRKHWTLGSLWSCRDSIVDVKNRQTSHFSHLLALNINWFAFSESGNNEGCGTSWNVKKRKEMEVYFPDGFSHIFHQSFIYQHCKVYCFSNANALRSRHSERCSKKKYLTETNEWMMHFVILYSFWSEKNMN